MPQTETRLIPWLPDLAHKEEEAGLILFILFFSSLKRKEKSSLIQLFHNKKIKSLEKGAELVF